MAYELFLSAFEHSETAGEARYWLHEFVHKGDLQVLDVAVLARRSDNTAVLHQSGDLGSQHGGRIGALVGGLLGAASGPLTMAALGAAGAAFGALSELLGSRDLYKDDLRELEQALSPGTSALLALLAPMYANHYARTIADFGGETMRFSLSNDAGQGFREAKRAFIARQDQRRSEQLAAWRSTTAAQEAELEEIGRELAQSYTEIGHAPAAQQATLYVHAAALRTRRDSARALLNQTLAAELRRLDAVLTALPAGQDTDSERSTLTAERRAVQQQLGASHAAELQERWRDIAAIEALSSGADHATKVEIDLLLAQLRDAYAAARQAHPPAEV